MGQANTEWKQQKHMSKTIYEQIGMSQHEVSCFDPKMVTLKGKKGHLIFRHTETKKKHVLQQWQWIVFGSAKPAQDEKPKTRRNMKSTNANPVPSWGYVGPILQQLAHPLLGLHVAILHCIK